MCNSNRLDSALMNSLILRSELINFSNLTCENMEALILNYEKHLLLLLPRWGHPPKNLYYTGNYNKIPVIIKGTLSWEKLLISKAINVRPNVQKSRTTGPVWNVAFQTLGPHLAERLLKSFQFNGFFHELGKCVVKVQLKTVKLVIL